MKKRVRLSVEENGMGEAQASLPLYLPEAVEVELPHEALKLAVPEKFGGDFCLHELRVEYVYVGFGGIPADDLLIGRILSKKSDTLSNLSSL